MNLKDKISLYIVFVYLFFVVSAIFITAAYADPYIVKTVYYPEEPVIQTVRFNK